MKTVAELKEIADKLAAEAAAAGLVVVGPHDSAPLGPRGGVSLDVYVGRPCSSNS